MTDPQIHEAAAQLRDDPTFRLSTRVEQEEEATHALRRSLHPEPEDPLAVALTIEEALSQAPPTAVATDPANVEACRADTPCGRPRAIAANGRCLDCGAVREAPGAQSEPPAADASAPAAKPLDQGANIISELMAAGGFGQVEVAKILEVSRQSVGFYASGKVAWEPKPGQVQRLAQAVRVRRDTLAALAAKLEGR